VKKLFNWYLESMSFNMRLGKATGIIYYLCRTCILGILLMLIFVWIKVHGSAVNILDWVIIIYLSIGILLYSFTAKYIDVFAKENKHLTIFTYGDWSKVGFIYLLIWPWAVIGIYQNNN